MTPTRVPHYTPRDVRLPRAVERRGADVLGRLRARRTSWWKPARDADLFVCEATLLRGELDGQPRGHLSLDEAVDAFEASGAKRLLVTHRPRELPTPDEFELAYDGLELDV